MCAPWNDSCWNDFGSQDSFVSSSVQQFEFILKNI